MTVESVPPSLKEADKVPAVMALPKLVRAPATFGGSTSSTNEKATDETKDAPKADPPKGDDCDEDHSIPDGTGGRPHT